MLANVTRGGGEIERGISPQTKEKIIAYTAFPKEYWANSTNLEREPPYECCDNTRNGGPPEFHAGARFRLAASIIAESICKVDYNRWKLAGDWRREGVAGSWVCWTLRVARATSDWALGLSYQRCRRSLFIARTAKFWRALKHNP